MIQTKITKDIYHGDGTTRRFEITFDYNTKNNIKQIDLYTCTYITEEGVTKYNNDVTKLTSNYDFEVVNNVTYAVYPSDAAVSDGSTPMATGTAIIIMRNTPNEQLSTGQYTSDKVEKQLDRLTMVSQELQEQINRCYKKPEYSEQVNDIDLDPTGYIEEIFEAAHDASVAAEHAEGYVEDAEGYAEDASAYATNASNSATDAYNSATNASGSATAAANSVIAFQTALAKINVPLLSFKWYDHLLNDQRWLRADTFSWQDGEVYSDAYNHLVNDIGYVRYMIPNDDIQEKFYRSPSDDTTMFAWTNQYSTLYTESEFPENGDNFYYHNQVFGTVLSTGTEAGSGVITPTTETIGSYTITYYLADDKHKICLADQETTVQNIYNATGNARYFILDTTNTRFKLPRWKHNKYQAKAPVIGNGLGLGLSDGTNNAGINRGISGEAILADATYGANKGTINTDNTLSIPTGAVFGITTDLTKSGIEATLEEDDIYLYFYVGQFTQSATEQTAGLNAELFNGKVDLNGSNATFAHIVETYSNGTDWYRVWSDGWCEQGGIKSVNYNNTTTNVSLLKQYIDTNYNILLSLGGYVASGTAQCSWQNKTISSFDIYGDYTSSTGTLNTYWEAKGYIS